MKSIATDAAHSTVTLDLPGSSAKCRVFHVSLVKPYIASLDDSGDEPALDAPPFVDDVPLPPASPPAKITRTGKEHFIRDIISHKKSGRGWRFLVRWKGFPDSDNEWMTYSALNHTRALEDYLKIHSLS